MQPILHFSPVAARRLFVGQSEEVGVLSEFDNLITPARAWVPIESVALAPRGFRHLQAATLPMNGLTVIADAKESDETRVTGLGADLVLSRGDDFPRLIQESYPGGVEGVIDGALELDRIAPAVGDGGTVITVRGYDERANAASPSHSSGPSTIRGRTVNWMSFVKESRTVRSHSRWPRRFLRTRHQRRIAAKRKAVSGVGWCWNSEITALTSDPSFRA